MNSLAYHGPYVNRSQSQSPQECERAKDVVRRCVLLVLPTVVLPVQHVMNKCLFKPRYNVRITSMVLRGQNLLK